MSSTPPGWTRWRPAWLPAPPPARSGSARALDDRLDVLAAALPDVRNGRLPVAELSRRLDGVEAGIEDPDGPLDEATRQRLGDRLAIVHGDLLFAEEMAELVKFSWLA